MMGSIAFLLYSVHWLPSPRASLEVIKGQCPGTRDGLSLTPAFLELYQLKSSTCAENWQGMMFTGSVTECFLACTDLVLICSTAKIINKQMIARRCRGISSVCTQDGVLLLTFAHVHTSTSRKEVLGNGVDWGGPVYALELWRSQLLSFWTNGPNLLIGVSRRQCCGSVWNHPAESHFSLLLHIRSSIQGQSVVAELSGKLCFPWFSSSSAHPCFFILYQIPWTSSFQVFSHIQTLKGLFENSQSGENG